MGRPEFPTLYAIIDAAVLCKHGLELREFCESLRAAGVQLVQYRDKSGSSQEQLAAAALINEAFSGSNCRLIMNDRPDLAVLANFNGVHVGQGDLSPEDVRRIIDPRLLVGVSTHSEEQIQIAAASCADYIAIGPVFATGTKTDTEPIIGLAGVRLARNLTTKPIVAIGGITRENARSVIDSGADSVAVISGLFGRGEDPQKIARDFIQIFR